MIFVLREMWIKYLGEGGRVDSRVSYGPRRKPRFRQRGLLANPSSNVSAPLSPRLKQTTSLVTDGKRLFGHTSKETEANPHFVAWSSNDLNPTFKRTQFRSAQATPLPAKNASPS